MNMFLDKHKSELVFSVLFLEVKDKMTQVICPFSFYALHYIMHYKALINVSFPCSVTCEISYAAHVSS